MGNGLNSIEVLLVTEHEISAVGLSSEREFGNQAKPESIVWI
jgi:hypothetical protein